MRRSACFIVVIILCLTFTYNALAYPEKIHNMHLELMLFGKKDFSSTNTNDMVKARVIALECASYLCIDQYNLGGINELSYLQGKPAKNYPDPKIKISGLPETIMSINFNGNFAHRKPTHGGWEPNPLPLEGNWPVRKSILLSTVKATVNFSKDTMNDNFGKLIYYIHIVGDHVHGETYNATRFMIPLARKTPGATNPDVFYELEQCLSVLFAEQKNEAAYIRLINDIQKLAEGARQIITNNNERFTPEEFAAYKDSYVNELLYVLCGIEGHQSYIADLFKKNATFRKAFYP